nr:reverse transcriptase domain-containing protein [Tanacetum cinerariifolium]
MPNNVKTYDGTGDPEDHVKIFEAAAQVERWAMPTWCHMFNSTLIGAARVWFDELPPESVDSYKDLKAAFLAYFMQQKKYVKDPIEIHNIKQKDRETIKDFMERFKAETGRMKDPLNEKSPLLAKRKVTHHEEHRTSQKGKLQKKGLTSEVIQGKERGLAGSPPYKDTKRNSCGRGSGEEGPLVIEAEIGGHLIYRMYVDEGSSMEILYEHCFNRLRPEVRNQMVPTTTSLTDLSGETIWPLGQLRLLEGYSPVRQKKRGQASERAKAIQAEVQKLVETGIMREVYYHDWLSNPVMIRSMTAVGGSKRLQRYFQAHPIAVITDQPIKQITSRPDVAGRLQKWSVLLGEHNITYRPRTSVKGQVLADFLAETPDESLSATSVVETQQESWTLFTDGSSCVDGSGAGLILTSPEGTKFTYVLRFQFTASNNEVEYEALIDGLRIVAQMKVQHVLIEILKEKSIQEMEVTTVVEEDGPTWMTPIMEYLKEGTLPSDRKEARKLRIKARQYELMEGVLYRRSFLTPWLRCVEPLQAKYVIREIYEGSCSMHAGPRSVVAKAIRLRYYWPTMHRDARDMIRTCNDYQIHRPVTRNPQHPLTSITAPWPFYKWGIDIAGPFSEGPVNDLRSYRVCPDKVEAVLSLPSPKCLKDVQRLNGKLASLNRFLSKSAEKSLPFFKTLKKCTKKSDFQWTAKAETAFKQMKILIAELPMLTAPKEKKELVIYLAAAKEAVSAVLMTKKDGKQMLIYFISRALQGPKINYTPMEKFILALVSASKRLKRYFQAHTIVVITDQPIKQMLSSSEVAGRLLKCRFEIEGDDIHYRPRTSVKGHILAYFIVERSKDDLPDTPMKDKEELLDPWILFTDGLSCIDGSRVGLIITNLEGMKFTYSLRFRFHATNNEAEYEALIASLRIAEQIGVKNLQANVDSKLVVNQVNETYIAKEPGMIKYLEKVKILASTFKEFFIKQVPRGENKKADALSKMASTSFDHLSKQRILPEEKRKATAIRRKAGRYAVTNGILYKRSFLGPWLRCVRPLQENYVLREIHEGSCNMQAGPRSVVAKALRSGFGLPGEIISDNEKQFRDNPFKDWCEKLCIRQCFASVKHPQANDLVERANRSLGEGIKARNGETSFSLMYGTEAVIPVEIGMPTLRTMEVDMIKNDEALEINLDLFEKKSMQQFRKQIAKL